MEYIVYIMPNKSDYITVVTKNVLTQEEADEILGGVL